MTRLPSHASIASIAPSGRGPVTTHRGRVAGQHLEPNPAASGQQSLAQLEPDMPGGEDRPDANDVEVWHGRTTRQGPSSHRERAGRLLGLRTTDRDTTRATQRHPASPERVGHDRKALPCHRAWF